MKNLVSDNIISDIAIRQVMILASGVTGITERNMHTCCTHMRTYIHMHMYIP